MKTKIKKNKQQHNSKIPVMECVFYWAVTGTFHGSIIEAETEGKARHIFHKYYKGETIINIKKLINRI
jgi:hypothetical protein